MGNWEKMGRGGRIKEKERGKKKKNYPLKHSPTTFCLTSSSAKRWTGGRPIIRPVPRASIYKNRGRRGEEGRGVRKRRGGGEEEKGGGGIKGRERGREKGRGRRGVTIERRVAEPGSLLTQDGLMEIIEVFTCCWWWCWWWWCE